MIEIRAGKYWPRTENDFAAVKDADDFVSGGPVGPDFQQF